MPVYLFTFHSYGSWLPDRWQGYVRRGEGVLPTNELLAEAYQEQMNQGAVWLDATQQRIALDAVHEKCGIRGWSFQAGGSEPSHLHVVVSWKEQDLDWLAVRVGIKSSITRRLNARVSKRSWLSEGGSRRRIEKPEHLTHLRRIYLPSHRGWGYDIRDGWREPRIDESIAGR